MRIAILFLILVFLVDLLGIYIGSYRFYFYDVILHFLGGFFVAMFFVSFFNNLKIEGNALIKNKHLIWALIITGSTLFIGVFWEFTEYLATIYFSEALLKNYGIVCCMGNLDDTIEDLALDSFGAIMFVFLRDIFFIKLNMSGQKKDIHP